MKSFLICLLGVLCTTIKETSCVQQMKGCLNNETCKEYNRPYRQYACSKIE